MNAKRWRPGGQGDSARTGTLGRILENAVWLLAGKGVGAVLSLIYLGLATRTLGPAGFGQFVLVLGTAQTVGALVGFQTWQLVVRYGMSHLNAGRTDALGRLIGFAATLDIAGAVAGCAIAALAIPLLGPHFGWDAEVRHMALAFAVVTLLSIRSTPVGILRLHDRFGVGAVADSMTPIVRLIGALVVFALGVSVKGFLIAWAAAEIVTAITYWTLAARVGGASVGWRYIGSIRGVVADNPGIAGFAAITNLGATLNAVGKQFAVVVVGLVAGPAAAGGYRLAHQLGQALAKLSEMMSRAVFAELTRVNFGAMQANLPRLFRNASRFSLIAAAVIVALLLLIGKPALHLVAGEAFVGAYPLLLILGTAAALDLGGVSFEPALMATDRAWLAFRLRVAATLLLIVLMAVLLPAWGPIGAAWATLAASAAGLLMFGIAAWRAVHREDGV